MVIHTNHYSTVDQRTRSATLGTNQLQEVGLQPGTLQHNFRSAQDRTVSLTKSARFRLGIRATSTSTPQDPDHLQAYGLDHCPNKSLRLCFAHTRHEEIRRLRKPIKNMFLQTVTRSRSKHNCLFMAMVNNELSDTVHCFFVLPPQVQVSEHVQIFHAVSKKFCSQ